MNPDFIIIDDDTISNIICSHTIGKFVNSSNIKCFQYPVEGLKYISTQFNDMDTNHQTILLLDINMPVLTGWDFINEYAKFSDSIHQQISIYMVSSSVDPKEKIKAEEHVFVNGFYEKPVMAEIVSMMIMQSSINRLPTNSIAAEYSKRNFNYL